MRREHLRILATGPVTVPEAKFARARPSSASTSDTLLRESDVVSLHVVC